MLTTQNLTVEEIGVPNPELYRRVWDTQDTIETSENGFSVLTNLVMTTNQKRGNCTPRGEVRSRNRKS
jgi:hypothetical protein